MSGLKLPHAYDPVSKKQSFRLLTAYCSFVLTILSLILLHIWPQLLVATAMTMLFSSINMIFYMLKKLESAKIDLDDKEISLNSEKNVDRQEEV